MLDVSSNLKLTRLSCGYNYMTTLDLYDNSELNYLWAYGMPSLEIIVKTGHVFSNGIYYDDGTTVTYVD